MLEMIGMSYDKTLGEIRFAESRAGSKDALGKGAFIGQHCSDAILDEVHEVNTEFSDNYAGRMPFNQGPIKRYHTPHRAACTMKIGVAMYPGSGPRTRVTICVSNTVNHMHMHITVSIDISTQHKT
jgi:hypothetical protein